MKFRKAFLMEPGHFEVKDVEENINENQILIKVDSCGLCNWELNFWKGYLNFCGYPHPLGHEYAGTVVEVGSEVEDFKVGDKACSLGSNFGGFAEYVVCDADRSVKIPEHLDTRYVLGEPLKCIMTVLDQTAVKPGDYGVVLGCGPMGQWCIQGLAGNLMAGLIAIDVDDHKLEMAKKYGATHVINSKKENVEERLQEITDGHMADFVIEGTGIPELINDAMSYIRTNGRGRLIIMSAYERVANQVDLRMAVDRSLDIIVAHPGHSFDEVDDLRRAVTLLSKGTLNVKDLISHEFSLDEMDLAFQTLEHKPKDYLKGLVYIGEKR